MKFQILLLGMLLTFAACKSSKVPDDTNDTTNNQKVEIEPDYSEDPASTFDMAKLMGCWLDSREENIQESGIRIFRPCDFESIPPSRFRYRIVFNDDSTCSWLTLSPNDAHFMTQGTWMLADDKTIVVIDENGQSVSSIEVEFVDDQVLKIKGE